MGSEQKPREVRPEASEETDPEGTTPDGLVRSDELPGQPLSILLFACSRHGEELAVEYYDPDDPPRCSHGDLMSRKPR